VRSHRAAYARRLAAASSIPSCVSRGRAISSDVIFQWSADVPLLEVSDLVQHFPISGTRKLVQAVNGVSLSVDTGETLALVGESGSGKTTVGRCVLGLIKPTGGLISFKGRPMGGRRTVRSPELRGRMQLVFQEPAESLDPRCLVGDTIGEPLRALGASRADRTAAVRLATQRVGLPEHMLDDYPGELSMGLQQRVGIARAIVSTPELIILDEPTSALDPLGRIDVRTIVRTAAARGAAVFLNSHLLSEVEQVCDRVGIIDHGRVVASGSLDDVLGQSETQVRVTGLKPSDLAAIEPFGPPTLDEDRLSVRPMDANRTHELVAQLVRMGAQVHDVRSGRGSLEQRFLELVARDRPPEGTPSAARLR
jgi:ABC-type glutathione transport system ATPase component